MAPQSPPPRGKKFCVVRRAISYEFHETQIHADAHFNEMVDEDRARAPMHSGVQDELWAWKDGCWIRQFQAEFIAKIVGD
jgi:hypothetical protein